MPQPCQSNDPDSPDPLASIRSKYREVAQAASGHFPYPVGRESALKLGYLPEWLDGVPAAALDRFVGVGNPFEIERPRHGWSVLDAGCGTGVDTLIAARLVGQQGKAVGVDATPEMVAVGRQAAKDAALGNTEFHEVNIESLPFSDASFDQVISNGVLNLLANKAAGFQELHRVLKPGGVMALADLLLMENLPDEVKRDPAAWAG